MLRPSTCWLGAMVVLGACSSHSESSPRPDRVIVVVLDTLRADNLQAYGCPRNTAPFIDELAERSVTFEEAWAPSSWTAPSTASLFTGLYPFQHGVSVGYWVTRARQSRAGQEDFIINCIPEAILTLPQILKDEGFETFGIADNPNVCAAERFDVGFDKFITMSYRNANAVNTRLKEHLEARRPGNRRSFYYLHYIDPHEPYVRRSEHVVADPGLTRHGRDTARFFEKKSEDRRNVYAALGASTRKPSSSRIQTLLANHLSKYDSEIHFVDAHIREAFELLEVGPNDLVILTADHGEEFLEHGALGHEFSLAPELLRIPLFVSWPAGGLQGGRAQGKVSLVDILPTILDALGIEMPPELSGVSLLPLAQGTPPPSRPLLFSRSHRDGAESGAHMKAVLQDGWLYQEIYPGHEQRLFHLTSDPGAQLNLAKELPDRVTTMAATLRAQEAQLPKWERSFTHHRQLNSEAIDRLKELGYAAGGD